MIWIEMLAGWIHDHKDILNTLINLFMLLVWALYFQLLLNAHRRQRRANILINRSGGHDLDARCLLSNMSAEAIYIEAVIVECDTVKTGQVSLTTLDTVAREPDGDPRRSWLQGPLQPGEMISLGSFKGLLDTAIDTADLEEFSLLVVANYGPDDNPVAARRSFSYDSSRPEHSPWVAGVTHQLRGRAQRRHLRRYLGEQV